MDNYSLTRKYFIGKNKPGVWASVYAYKPHNEEFFKKRGEIFAVVTLKGPKDFDTSTAGNLLLDFFHESYFENDKDKILIALEKAVLGTEKRLVTLIENDPSVMEHGVELHVLATVVHDGFIYFVSMGQARVYVYRDGNLLDLSTHLKDPTGEDLIKIASSKIRRGDTFMLTTPETIDEYTEDDLFESVSKFTEQNIRGRMVEDDSKIALLMIKVFGEGEKEEDVEAIEVAGSMSANSGIYGGKEGADGASEGMEDRADEGNDLEIDEREEFSSGTNSDSSGPVIHHHSEGEEIMSHGGVEGEEGDFGGRENFSEQKSFSENLIEKVKEFFGKVWAFILSAKDKAFSQKGDVQAVRSQEFDSAGEVPAVADMAKDKELPTYLFILKKIGRKILEVLKKIKEVIWKALGLNEDKIFLRGSGVKQNWKLIAVLIVVIGFVLYFGIKSQIDEANLKKLTGEAQALIDASKVLTGDVTSSLAAVLNSPGNDTRKNELATQLDEASGKLSEAEELGVLADEINSEKSNVENLRNKLNRVVVVQATLLTDFAANFEGVNIYDMDFLDGNLYITDQNRSVVYKLAASGGEPTEFIPSGSGLSGPKSISIDQDKNLMINDGSDDKVIAEVDSNTKTVTKFTGLSQTKVGNLVQIDAYRVGTEDRIYAVRPENKDLVYMSKTGSGYSIPFLRAKEDAFASASDLAVDGRVYILSEGAGLSRYFGDKKDPFTIEGMAQGDSINQSVAMDLDLKRLFFADPSNSRILVFTKGRGDNGSIFDFIAQIKSTDGGAFSNLKEVVVDPTANNLYVLDGTKVWKIDLSITSEFEY